ncbi:hypothetical protein FQZ97_797060 [compost metagenome]
MVTTSQRLEVGGCQRHRTLIGGYNMLATLERPAAMGNGRFSVMRVRECGLDNNVSRRLPDDLFVVSFRRATGKPGEAAFLEIGLDEHSCINAVSRDDGAKVEIGHCDNVEPEAEFRLPEVVSLGHELRESAVDSTESDKSYVVLYHAGSSSWAMRRACRPPNAAGRFRNGQRSGRFDKSTRQLRKCGKKRDSAEAAKDCLG